MKQEAEEDEENDVVGTPRSYPRRRSRIRQGSSGNTMLDQLLSDISNKFVKYVDEVHATLVIKMT